MDMEAAPHKTAAERLLTSHLKEDAFEANKTCGTNGERVRKLHVNDLMIMIHICGAFYKFPDIFVQVFKIVVDS